MICNQTKQSRTQKSVNVGFWSCHQIMQKEWERKTNEVPCLFRVLLPLQRWQGHYCPAFLAWIFWFLSGGKWRKKKKGQGPSWPRAEDLGNEKGSESKGTGHSFAWTTLLSYFWAICLDNWCVCLLPTVHSFIFNPYIHLSPSFSCLMLYASCTLCVYFCSTSCSCALCLVRLAFFRCEKIIDINKGHTIYAIHAMSEDIHTTKERERKKKNHFAFGRIDILCQVFPPVHLWQLGR